MKSDWLYSNDPRVNFWRDEADYFRDSSDYVFLPRAVQALGKALYEGDWTGHEPATPWQPPLPDSPEHCDEADWTYCERLLLLYDAQYRYRVSADALFLPTPTAEEYVQARELSLLLDGLTREAFNRFVAVARILVALFEAGTLDTGYRAEEGGAICTIDRSFWNSESAVVRFNCCRIHPAEPFTWNIVDKGGLLVFVGRQRLQSLISSVLERRRTPQPEVRSTVAEATTAHGPTPARKRSPYLMLVDAVLEELDFDCDDPSMKKQTIVDALKSRWPENHPRLSDRLVQALATIIRAPEAQRGGNKGARMQNG